MKLQALYSDRVGHFVLEYGDDDSLSILFSVGSHTENHRINFDEITAVRDYASYLSKPVVSKTVEMMPRGDKIIEICSQYKDYWEEPLLDYFPVELLPELIAKIGSI